MGKLLAIILVTLTGCAAFEEENFYKEPAIVHIDRSQVVVQFWVGFRSDHRATIKEVTRVAKRGCAKAVYHSETCEGTTYGGEAAQVCEATFDC